MQIGKFGFKWHKLALICLLFLGCGASYNLSDFREYSKKDREFDARMYPVMSTMRGVHTYDGEWPDCTVAGRKNKEKNLEKSLEELSEIDTTGWPIDDQIDYMMNYNNVRLEKEMGLSEIYHENSPFHYLEMIYTGLTAILLRDPYLGEETMSSVLSRIRKVPEFLSIAGKNLRSSNYADCQYSLVSVQRTTDVIKGVCDDIIARYPERNAEISSLKNKSVLAARQFSQDALERATAPESAFFLGEGNYRIVIRDLFFLDFDCDSIMNLAATVFHEADSLENYYRTKIPHDEDAFPWHHDYIVYPGWDSIIAYSSYQEDLLERFLDANDIIAIPDGLLRVEFIEVPSFLESRFFKKDVFGGPGPLDTNRIAYYYIGESVSWRADGESPFGVAPNRSFKENMVEKIIRGNYLVSQMASTNPSIHRQMSSDQMYIIGWNYYIWEVLLQMGLFENQDEMLAEYYGSLKTIALQTIADVGFNLGKHDVDVSRKMFIDSLQMDSDYAEFRTYFSSIFPYNSLSCIVGRELFKDMRKKAQALEGVEFDLELFHGKILTEGAIPPMLIARKYGWEL